MSHVLFLTYDGLTDPLGQSQILPYLKGLTRFGYRFSIISFEKDENFQRNKYSIEQSLTDSPINWIALKYHKKPPVLSAVYDLKKMKKAAVNLYKSDPYQLVHTRSGTPAIAGLYVKRRLGVKFLNDLRDFYSYSKVDSGQWPQSNPLFRLIFNYFKRQEDKQLTLSDGIVCLTQKAKKITAKSESYNLETPIEVIPCSVDLHLFNRQTVKSEQQAEYKRRLGITDSDLVFSYLGSIGTWYLISELFLLFKTIKAYHKNAKLLMISPDNPEIILAEAAKLGIAKADLRSVRGDRSEIPVLLSLSSFSMFFIKACYSKQASSPTKLGEIMAMGIPVITNDGVGDVTDIITQCRAGIVLKELTSRKYEEVAKELTNYHFDSDEIQSGARGYFDLDNAISLYHSLYDRVFERNPTSFSRISERSRPITV